MFDPNQPQTISLRNYVIQLLQKTLDPTNTKQATSELELMISTSQLGPSLILISGEESTEQPVRMAALVFLKNMVQLQFKNWNIKYINDQDLQILKKSIFPLLVRIVQRNETKLLPTMKYICFLFSKYLYKENKWDSLIPQLLSHLELCESFETVKATLIMIKILFQIVGKTIIENITLNNLATKIVLPLINLASKMFANLSVFSCISLEEVFKILTEAVEFHLPEVVHNNIHIFMVLAKNLLDMKADGIQFENAQQYDTIVRILRLKKQALVFLNIFYIRHSTSNVTEMQPFVIEFNQKYTKPYFETIVGIIMSKAIPISNITTEQQQVISALHFSLITQALGIFSSITGNSQSSKCIEEDLQKYQIKILYLSMEKFLNCHSRKLQNKIEANLKKENLFQNYTDFLETFREQRTSLRLFLSTIFSNRKTQNRHQNIEEILNLLLKCVTEGSLKEKELSLYLLASLQQDIQNLSCEIFQSLNQKMIILLKQYVFPLINIQLEGLSNKDLFFAKLIKLRAFEMYRRLQFLEIGQEHSIQLCEKIFEELSSPNSSQIDVFVKIQAVETFNEILGKDNSLIPKLSGKIPELLSIYTDLLTKDFEVMKYYEEILSMFSEYIEPIVYQLLELLCDMFFKLIDEKTMKFNCLSGQGKYGRGTVSYGLEEDEKVYHEEEILQESDNQTIYEDIAHDYDSIGSQCLASIKKLIFKHPLYAVKYQNSPILQQKLLLLTIHGLSSRDQQITKQTLAIINLLLYKKFVPANMHFILPVLLYPVFITSNLKFAQQIQAYVQASPYSVTLPNQEIKRDFNYAYINLLKVVGKDVFSRPFGIFDEIGCIKNFIKVLKKELYQLRCPISNKTYLQMLIQVVIMIEQCPDQQAYSKGQVLSILSIYQVLLQNNIFEPLSYHPTFTLDPYFLILIKNIIKWSMFVNNSTLDQDMKQRFKSFYFRIIMVAFCSYPFEFYKFIQGLVAGHYIDSITNDYPFEHIFFEMNKLVLESTLNLLDMMKKLNDESSHLLNETYITFQGILSILETLVRYFVIQNDTQNLVTNLPAVKQRLKLINQRTHLFFSRLYFILLKLGYWLALIGAKQCDDDCYEAFAQCDQFYDMKKTLDQLIIQGIGKVNLQNQEESEQNEANLLIGMLNNLNIVSQKELQPTQNNMDFQFSQPKPPKYQVKFQHDLKHSQSMMDNNESSSDQSDLGSFGESDDSNPFESSDEEYLYAYDSVIFGGSFTESKKAIMGKIMYEIERVCHSKDINLLGRVFAQRL